MTFVRLRLNTDVHLTASRRPMFAESSQTLFQILVHLADRRGGQVITEGAVPDNQGRRELRMPGLRRAIGQIHGLPPEVIGFLPLFLVKRSNSAVGKWLWAPGVIMARYIRCPPAHRPRPRRSAH